mgnify:CR=1 FL=1
MILQKLVDEIDRIQKEIPNDYTDEIENKGVVKGIEFCINELDIFWKYTSPEHLEKLLIKANVSNPELISKFICNNLRVGYDLET